MSYVPPQPQLPLALPDARLDASHAREQMRHAPHMIILREMERLDEALAEKRDPWPAFYAFTSTLDAWVDDDPQFAIDMREAQSRRAATARAQHNLEYAWQAVCILRTPYVKLMRRLGVFKDLNIPSSKLTEARKAQRAPAANAAKDASGTQ